MCGVESLNTGKLLEVCVHCRCYIACLTLNELQHSNTTHATAGASESDMAPIMSEKSEEAAEAVSDELGNGW